MTWRPTAKHKGESDFLEVSVGGRTHAHSQADRKADEGAAMGTELRGQGGASSGAKASSCGGRNGHEW